MASGKGKQVYDEDVVKKLEITRYALMELNEILTGKVVYIPNGTSVFSSVRHSLAIIREALGKTELPVAEEGP